MNHFSPSENHRFLFDQLKPALAYPGGDPAAWRERLRRKVAELLAVPAPTDVTLNPRTLWEQNDELGTITKLVFTAEPYADVPAYFCVPHDVPPPYPVVICLQGHSSGMHNSIGRAFDDEFARIDVSGDRDFALGAMRHGYAALCIEQRSFGYRAETKQERTAPHGCHDAAMTALLLGRTLVGERIFDVDRGLDYLAERGDVDFGRVGVLGNSGGGTVTMYSAVLLDRIRFAMPSCSFATFADSIGSMYHCADNYIPGLAAWADVPDILGLFAPKPLVVVSGRDDPIFPLASSQAAFETLQRIYADAGAADRCKLVIGDGGHRFYEDPGWAGLLELLP